MAKGAKGAMPLRWICCAPCWIWPYNF